MSLTRVLSWALPLSLLSLLSHLGAAAYARTIELKVSPLLREPTTGCPQKVIAYETPQPSQGGFTTQGMIQLSAIATNIRTSTLDDFTATWVGTLKPQYRNCQASAGMFITDGQAYTGHSYIRLQMVEGQVRAILDMTGMRDPNNYTDVIINHTLRDGNPRWTWGGTD